MELSAKGAVEKVSKLVDDAMQKVGRAC